VGGLEAHEWGHHDTGHIGKGGEVQFLSEGGRKEGRIRRLAQRGEGKKVYYKNGKHCLKKGCIGREKEANTLKCWGEGAPLTNRKLKRQRGEVPSGGG